jgi:hypothetical protein
VHKKKKGGFHFSFFFFNSDCFLVVHDIEVLTVDQEISKQIGLMKPGSPARAVMEKVLTENEVVKKKKKNQKFQLWCC